MKCSLQWRHNERDGVSNQQRLDCLLNRFFKVQIKENIEASLAFVQGIHRWPVNSPHKEPVPQKMFPCDDVITCLAIICNKTSSEQMFARFHDALCVTSAQWVNFKKSVNCDCVY